MTPEYIALYVVLTVVGLVLWLGVASLRHLRKDRERLEDLIIRNPEVFKERR